MQPLVLHRLILAGRVDLQCYLEKRDKLEQELEKLDHEIDPKMALNELLANASRVAFLKEAKFIQTELETAR